MLHAPGRAWDPATAFRDQPGIREHVAYWEEADAAGSLVCGGPFPDGAGGLMVLDATPEAAGDLARRDPAVVSGLLEASVHPWLAVFRKGI